MDRAARVGQVSILGAALALLALSQSESAAEPWLPSARAAVAAEAACFRAATATAARRMPSEPAPRAAGASGRALRLVLPASTSARAGRSALLASAARGPAQCAPERCDGVDNDCDGEIDEVGALDCTPLYEDRDGDLFGAPGSVRCTCEAERGLSANDYDCDDGDARARPGAVEQCDGEIDNDCDGEFDLCGAVSRQLLQPGDVVVQRFQERPAGLIDADGEWFEIANRTDRAFELMGLELRDDGVDRFRIDRSLVIPPRGRLVLARNGDPATNGGRAVDYVYPDFILSDFGDVIEIVNRGQVIDRLRYGPRPQDR